MTLVISHLSFYELHSTCIAFSKNYAHGEGHIGIILQRLLWVGVVTSINQMNQICTRNFVSATFRQPFEDFFIDPFWKAPSSLAYICSTTIAFEGIYIIIDVGLCSSFNTRSVVNTYQLSAAWFIELTAERCYRVIHLEFVSTRKFIRTNSSFFRIVFCGSNSIFWSILNWMKLSWYPFFVMLSQKSSNHTALYPLSKSF